MMKLMKILLLSSVLWLGQAMAVIVPHPSPPAVAAKSYVLMDYASGQILAQKEAQKRLPPASITKLMTAYVVSHEIAAGHIHLTDKVLISEKAWRTVGSKTFVEVNTKVPVETLLKGMIIQSGNDAAVALAEYVAGSEDAFAQLMNQYAQQLGMKNTHYRNATGLPAQDHYTTAEDIAILARAIIRDFPEDYKWYAEKEMTYNKITQHNRNKLLWRDPSVDGLKTGHTQEAGYCLVASAKRGEMRLISVVLGTRSDNARAEESEKLLNYGFRFFESHRLYKAHEKITTVKVWKGQTDQLNVGLTEDLAVAVPRGRYKELLAQSTIKKPLMAPVAEGTKVGQVDIHLGNKILASRPLVALDSIPEGSWWQKIWDSLMLLIWG